LNDNSNQYCRINITFRIHTIVIIATDIIYLYLTSRIAIGLNRVTKQMHVIQVRANDRSVCNNPVHIMLMRQVCR